MRYIRTSFKSATTYKSSIIFSSVGISVYILVQIALWNYLYSGNGSQINYMTTYVILSSILSIFYTKDMYGLISQKVANGDFALELIKPINFLVASYFKSIGILLTKIIFKGIPLLIFIPFVYKNIVFENLIFSIIAILLGHYIFVVLYSIVGLSTFVIIESWAFQRLLDDTIRFISGSVIPLSLFPGFLQNLSKFLPFQYLYYFPLSLMLENLEKTDMKNSFIISIFWALIFTFFLIFFYKKSLKRLVIQGG